jgi:ABC-type uncharacterized transport system substrate-binding protein
MAAVALGVLAAPAASARDLVVLFLAEPTHPPHAQLLRSLKQRLGDTEAVNIVLQVTSIEDLPGYAARVDPGDFLVTVAVGARSAAETVHPPAVTTPVVYTLVTRAQYDLVAAQRAERVAGAESTAIYLDQPFSRRLRLLRASLPMTRRIGVVIGPSSAPYVPELRRELANTARLDIQMAASAGEVMTALRRALARSDAVLALPDPVVYNPHTMKGILLTTYRHRAPLIGLSQAYVRAGAIAAVYSTPGHTGTQLAELLLDLARSPEPKLPPPAFPEDYDVAVNPTVANSLGIHLLPAARLKEILRQDYLGTEPLL